MRQKVNIFSKTKLLLMAIVSAGMVASCVNDELFRDDLPDTNSKVDTVLPAANFSYAASSDDFRIINFTNLATEATVFEWDFGNGNTSTEQDPTFTFNLLFWKLALKMIPCQKEEETVVILGEIVIWVV